MHVHSVHTQANGTNLYSDWATGRFLFTNMVEKTMTALEAAPDARLRGMIWVQGESDAMSHSGQVRGHSGAWGFITAIKSH